MTHETEQALEAQVSELATKCDRLERDAAPLIEARDQAVGKVAQLDSVNVKLRAQLATEIAAKELAEAQLRAIIKAVRNTKGGVDVLERIASDTDNEVAAEAISTAPE